MGFYHETRFSVPKTRVPLCRGIFRSLDLKHKNNIKSHNLKAEKSLGTQGHGFSGQWRSDSFYHSELLLTWQRVGKIRPSSFTATTVNLPPSRWTTNGIFHSRGEYSVESQRRRYVFCYVLSWLEFCESASWHGTRRHVASCRGY